MRTVRKRLADGTIKEYRYPRRAAARAPRIAAGTLDALLAAYRRSPEWAALRPASRATYATYLRIFDHRGDMAVTEVTRRLLMDIRDAVAVKRGHGAANGFLNTAAALIFTPPPTEVGCMAKFSKLATGLSAASNTSTPTSGSTGPAGRSCGVSFCGCQIASCLPSRKMRRSSRACAE